MLPGPTKETVLGHHRRAMCPLPWPWKSWKDRSQGDLPQNQTEQEHRKCVSLHSFHDENHHENVEQFNWHKQNEQQFCSSDLCIFFSQTCSNWGEGMIKTHQTAMICMVVDVFTTMWIESHHSCRTMFEQLDLNFPVQFGANFGGKCHAKHD